MKIRISPWFASLVFIFPVIFLALNASVADEPRTGAIVEQVDQDSEGRRVGIREGDVLLVWARGNQSASIKSPFDLAIAEIEESPRGDVTIEGLRAATKLTWTLHPDRWGIRTRPIFPESFFHAYREGAELVKVHKLSEAADLWRNAATKLQGIDSLLSSWLFFRAGEILADAGLWSAADDAYQAAIQQAANNLPIRMHLYQAWARTFQVRKDPVNAAKRYRQVLAELHDADKMTLSAAASLNALANLAWERRDLAEAESNYRQALTIRQELAPQSLGMAKALNGLGTVAFARGDFAEAERCFDRAMKITAQMVPMNLDLANSLNNLAVLADQRGDLDKAEHYHQRALEIHESLAPNSLNLATSLDNMGNLAWQHGDLAKAESYHRRALQIREERAPESLSVAASLTNLGSDAQARGDLAGAKEFYLRGLAIKEKLAPATLDVANSLNNLGNIAREEGDLAGAERYYRKTLEIRERLAPNSLDVAAGLQNLGEAGQDRRNWIEAKDYYLSALSIEQSIAPSGVLAAESLNHLAEVGRALGDVAAAEDYYRQALRIRESVAPGSLAHAESLAGLAAVMRTKGRLDEAAQLLAQALDAFENQTGRLGGTEDIRSGFKAKYEYFYLDDIDLLMSQKQAESAFQVLERSRARSLLAMLTAARIDIRKGADPQLLEMEHRLREALAAKSSLQIRMRTGPHTEEQVANLRRESEELLARYQQVEEQVRASSPSYAALTQPQPLNMKDVQGLLDKESLLLEYSLGEQRSYVWVVSANSLASYELPKRAEIERVARELYELLTARNRIIKDESGLKKQARLAGIQEQYRECAGRLASMILDPVAGYLQAKRLLIVSDGALQYVPFSALPSPVTGGPLVVEHEIVNLPSASVLAVLRREMVGRPEPPKAVAVLADPVFSIQDSRVNLQSKKSQNRREKQPMKTKDGSFYASVPHARSVEDADLADHGNKALQRLTFTRQEAEAIMAATPSGQGMEALGFAASRSTAMSPNLAQYRIVHFAAHGVLDSKHPELSGLVLSLVNSRGEPQNGFLDLQDIYNLNLPVDMVVLSACETALGKEIRGEGLVGLTRGFMYAGASRVVASLWNVDDVATAELMRRFYKAILGEGLPPASALRKAQVEMARQKRWSDPYYWAAFTIEGEWRPIHP